MDDDGAHVGSVVPGLVRRVRRIARLSQRELAMELGVGQATVARWEQGLGSMSASALEQVARRAGLGLALVDAQGSPVTPMRDDAAHDVRGRRMPAHVETELAGWWVPRDSTTTGAYTAALRKSRAEGRAVVTYSRHPLLRVDSDEHHDDHPTRADLVHRLERAERALRTRRLGDGTRSVDAETGTRTTGPPD